MKKEKKFLKINIIFYNANYFDIALYIFFRLKMSRWLFCIANAYQNNK